MHILSQLLASQSVFWEGVEVTAAKQEEFHLLHKQVGS